MGVLIGCAEWVCWKGSILRLLAAVLAAICDWLDDEGVRRWKRDADIKQLTAEVLLLTLPLLHLPCTADVAAAAFTLYC